MTDRARSAPVIAAVMLVALAGGCAGTQPARLSVRAGLPGQGALPEVWCDVSATRRSDNGLPLLRVLVESPCTTNPKLVLFAFDEQKTILERAFARRLQPRRGPCNITPHGDRSR